MVQNFNLKILLPIAGVVLVVVSIFAFNSLIAGIGIGIASVLILGPDVEDKRGKTAGIVYSKNRSGPYTKSRTVPRNPKSNAQQMNRDIHRSLMKQWKSPEVDHKAYNDYASSHLVSNKMGKKVYLSGINWFVRINRYAMKANPGCGLILTPPAGDTQFPSITDVKLTAGKEPDTVTVELVKLREYSEGMKLQVFATRQMSAGVSFAKGFVEIGVYEPAHALDITADYVGRWGNLNKGMKIF